MYHVTYLSFCNICSTICTTHGGESSNSKLFAIVRCNMNSSNNNNDDDDDDDDDDNNNIMFI